ncbi:MAG: hypothetical protein WC835_01800 [Candidatus Paceibacterota bacterium]|jgi:hypothetical protein
MADKSTSLHHTDTKNGLCISLSFNNGSRWKLSATPIPLGFGKNECPQISSSDSRTVNTRELEEAIALAKERREKKMTLRVNGHSVELIVKNVENKMAHVREIEASYTFNKPKRKEGKRR